MGNGAGEGRHGWGERLRWLLGRNAVPIPRDPAALFARFQAVLAGNNRALEAITDLGEKLSGDYLFDITYTRRAVVLALLFETLPFVIRSVQPVLLELDRDMEDAAASLGARGHTVFRRIVLPNLLPAILSGMALAFARAVGEYGSVVMLSGNVPFSTEVSSVHIYSQIQSDYVAGAAAGSIVLLTISLVVLTSITLLQRRSSKHAG